MNAPDKNLSMTDSSDPDDLLTAMPAIEFEDDSIELPPFDDMEDEPAVPPSRDPEQRFAEAMAGRRYEDAPHVTRPFTPVPRVDRTLGMNASSAALALEY